MTTAFITGPWTVENVEFGEMITDDLCILGPSPDFRAVAQIDRCFQGDRIPAMEAANARLIAAAPELLVAAQEAIKMLNHLIGLTPERVVIDKVELRAEIARCSARISPAIAKATEAPA